MASYTVNTIAEELMGSRGNVLPTPKNQLRLFKETPTTLKLMRLDTPRLKYAILPVMARTNFSQKTVPSGNCYANSAAVATFENGGMVFISEACIMNPQKTRIFVI